MYGTKAFSATDATSPLAFAAIAWRDPAETKSGCHLSLAS